MKKSELKQEIDSLRNTVNAIYNKSEVELHDLRWVVRLLLKEVVQIF